MSKCKVCERHHNKKSEFCSDKCQIRYLTNVEPVEKQCEFCAKSFKSYTPGNRFCSHTCRCYHSRGDKSRLYLKDNIVTNEKIEAPDAIIFTRNILEMIATYGGRELTDDEICDIIRTCSIHK